MIKMMFPRYMLATKPQKMCGCCEMKRGRVAHHESTRRSSSPQEQVCGDSHSQNGIIAPPVAALFAVSGQPLPQCARFEFFRSFGNPFFDHITDETGQDMGCTRQKPDQKTKA
jgi:hypothetical protein